MESSYQGKINSIYKNTLCEIYGEYKKDLTNEVPIDCEFHGGIMKEVSEKREIYGAKIF